MDTIKRVTRWFRSSNKKSHQVTAAHNTNCSISSSSRSGGPQQQRCAIDREYNAVVVPAYGGDCLSVSDSDGSDWSIGWTEPHGSGFEAEQGIRDRNDDSSFAVLVRCYKSGSVQHRGSSFFRPPLDDARTVSDGESYMQQWLASLPLPDPDCHDHNQIQHQNITALS